MPAESSTSLQMNDLETSTAATATVPTSHNESIPLPATMDTSTPFAHSFAQNPAVSEAIPSAIPSSSFDTPSAIVLPTAAHSATSDPMPSTMASAPAQLSRLDFVAIGPSTDEHPIIPNGEAANAVCVITLLLTTGARHPYKLDEKYLAKRNVHVPGVTESGKKDPFSISVYTLKELILREWREEWEARPSSPSSIRLIHFGRLLDDKIPLKDCRFNVDSPNVVHMTVKPQDIVDDEDAGKSGTKARSDTERTPGCRCAVM